jgi:DNA-binding winged helix-turn-helix (wHTH) protein/Flp pilus assembly protein TadD
LCAAILYASIVTSHPHPRLADPPSSGLRLVRSTVPPGDRLAATIAFGEFRLDTTRRRLIRGSEITHLPERLFGVLSLLVQANGAVVNKETFASVVWRDVVMTDSNLAQHVYQLRRLLRETKREGSPIVAASGRGYRLTLPVAVEHVLGATSRELEPLVYCCQGTHLLERQSAPALKRAIEFFDAALAVEPNYTPALVGLARAYVLLAECGFVPAAPAFRNAREAVGRALELTPDSAIAHAVQSELFAFGEWDWTRAQREIDVALQLDPASTFVRNNAAWLHICTGSYDRAMSEAQLALKGEPASLTFLLLLVNVFIHSGRYQRAITILSNLLEIDSAIRIVRRYRAQAYLLDNRPTDAIVDLQLLAREQPNDLSVRLPLLARAYADGGDLDRAAEIYSKLLEAARTEYVPFWNLAIVATGLGKLSEAIGYLEKALAAREPALSFLGSLPWFQPISRLARYEAIVTKVRGAVT